MESREREPVSAEIVGQSKLIQDIRVKLGSLASCDVNVLIYGESGTGKEVVARAIHNLSDRADKSFVPVNLAAMEDSLFTNEMYGHTKGAFTDAGGGQIGLVQAAEGGTLFLDELSTTSRFVQAKLLRLLQDGKEYKTLGDPVPRKANIRILAATNQDLRNLAHQGNFREDLFYRLNVVSLYIPPLRERAQDIPVLSEYFMDRYARQFGKSPVRLSKGAMQLLHMYPWPGNVRELENVIQHIVVMTGSSTIHREDLPLPVQETHLKKNRIEPLSVAKETFERSYLEQLLREYRGDVPRASKVAGKSRTGLWNLIRKHHLSPRQIKHASDRKSPAQQNIDPL